MIKKKKNESKLTHQVVFSSGAHCSNTDNPHGHLCRQCALFLSAWGLKRNVGLLLSTAVPNCVVGRHLQFCEDLKDVRNEEGEGLLKVVHRFITGGNEMKLSKGKMRLDI